jgi:hypothetical protein
MFRNQSTTLHAVKTPSLNKNGIPKANGRDVKITDTSESALKKQMTYLKEYRGMDRELIFLHRCIRIPECNQMWIMTELKTLIDNCREKPRLHELAIKVAIELEKVLHPPVQKVDQTNVNITTSLDEWEQRLFQGQRTTLKGDPIDAKIIESHTENIKVPSPENKGIPTVKEGVTDAEKKESGKERYVQEPEK